MVTQRTTKRSTEHLPLLISVDLSGFCETVPLPSTNAATRKQAVAKATLLTDVLPVIRRLALHYLSSEFEQQNREAVMNGSDYGRLDIYSLISDELSR